MCKYIKQRFEDEIVYSEIGAQALRRGGSSTLASPPGIYGQISKSGVLNKNECT